MKSVSYINISVYLLIDNNKKTWFADREESVFYKTNLTGKEAAEEAFSIANTKKELLTEKQKLILDALNTQKIKLRMGDVVRVENPHKPKGVPAEYFLRLEDDWEKFDGDVIQLLKHFK